MNVEIGTEATQFPDQEYVNGIFVAVQAPARKPTFVRAKDKQHMLLGFLDCGEPFWLLSCDLNPTFFYFRLVCVDRLLWQWLNPTSSRMP
jgi:hypothetical protein